MKLRFFIAKFDVTSKRLVCHVLCVCMMDEISPCEEYTVVPYFQDNLRYSLVTALRCSRALLSSFNYSVPSSNAQEAYMA